MDLAEIKRLMHSGAIYYETPEVGIEQQKLKELLYDFNQAQPAAEAEKQRLLKQLLGKVGQDVYIEQPLRANWGSNTYLGDRVYANFNLTLVDDTKIEILDDVMIGPNVTIITGTHPLQANLRLKKAQYNQPVMIKQNVWIGAGAIILPGVTIGENTVIGAGSIVTKDIPANVLALGTPCNVIKTIE